MEEKFFSIIIPVYNGLSHDLPKCLDSIWNQPLDKKLYEVVCVDDCSTDGTREWLEEQLSYHANLRLIKNKVNIRQGGGRNRGMKEARGKYIVLIDQDDYYHKGALAEVYEHLCGNPLEILIVDCAYQSPGRESNKLQHNFPHREVMTGDEIIERNSIPYAPWKFIFLRSLILEKNLFFAENERIEDVDWVHLLVHNASRVQYQPILFIHYNKSSISTTMTTYKSCETVYSTLRLGNRLNRMVETVFANSSDNVKHYMSALGERFYYLGLRNYFFFYDKVSMKSACIKDTILIAGRKSAISNRLVRLATFSPKLFSFGTNCLCPLGRMGMNLYRWLKYK